MAINGTLPRQVFEKTENGLSISNLPFLMKEKIVAAAFFPLLIEGSVKGQLIIGFRSRYSFTTRELRLLSSLSEKSSIAFAGAKLYRDLQLREEELETLSYERVAAQEAERLRISRELHDGLGQILTAIKFNIEVLEDNHHLGNEDLTRIDDMKKQLDTATQEIREISHNLMPSVLADFGLVPSLQMLCDEFTRSNTFQVKYMTQGVTERLGTNIEVGIYRICQESLNNIAKHARASEATVQLICTDTVLRFVVEDDGIGFQYGHDSHRHEGRMGMGLLSMRERARSMKGTLTVDSSTGHGTLISVEIPLH